jgi:hypothetical protein
VNANFGIYLFSFLEVHNGISNNLVLSPHSGPLDLLRCRFEVFDKSRRIVEIKFVFAENRILAAAIPSLGFIKNFNFLQTSKTTSAINRN